MMVTFAHEHIVGFYALYLSERREIAEWLGVSREPEESDTLYAKRIMSAAKDAGKLEELADRVDRFHAARRDGGVKEATGYAIVDTGVISVNTVCGTRRGAIVNWLLIAKGLAATTHTTDEQIERMWDANHDTAEVRQVKIR